MSMNLPPTAGHRWDMKAPTPQQGSLAFSAVEHLHTASDPFDLLQRFRLATARLGATSALFVHTVPDAEGQDFHYLLLDCDAGLAAGIRNCRSLQFHPWLKYAARQNEPICATALPAQPAPTSPSAVDLEGQGFKSCLLVPNHSGGGTGRFSLLCLGSEEAGHFEAATRMSIRLIAESLVVELHSWWMAETRRQIRQAARLRSDDLQLLAMEHDGQSTKQIARTLNISCSSVDSRFQRINLKMNCSSRKASAAKAVCHGLF